MSTIVPIIKLDETDQEFYDGIIKMKRHRGDGKPGFDWISPHPFLLNYSLPYGKTK